MSAIIATTEHDEGSALIDGMTPVHLVLGFFAGALGVDPKVAVATFIGARIIETAVRKGTGHALYGREEAQSLGNELGDVLALMAGSHLGHYLRDQAAANATAGLGADCGKRCEQIFEAAKVYDKARLEVVKREVALRFRGKSWFRGVGIGKTGLGEYSVDLLVSALTPQLAHSITHETRDIAWKPYPIAIRAVGTINAFGR
jgi:hypothetical protein